MNRSLHSFATLAVAAVFVASSLNAQPPEAPQPADTLTAKRGTPEHKAVAAIFEAWNSTHTRARAAIKTATDRYRAKKEQVPPVVHYAGALVMMQIGAYAAPDVENSLLPKAGDHPLVSLAKARIAVREEDFSRALKSAGQAIDDKRIGDLGQSMKEAVDAMGRADDPESKSKSSAGKTTSGLQAVQLIADAREKSEADLKPKRDEMQRLDNRYKASETQLARLQRELVIIQNRSAGVLPGGGRGYYFSINEKSLAVANCQQRITAVENERAQARTRHAELKKYEAAETAKLTWRIWSARLPWNVEDERKRLTEGKSPAEYYVSPWEYKASLPDEFPKQIPPPYTPNRKKK